MMDVNGYERLSNITLSNSSKGTTLLLLFFIFHFFTCIKGVMVLTGTFNNISVISRWSVLLVEENGVSEEKPTYRKSLTN